MISQARSISSLRMNSAASPCDGVLQQPFVRFRNRLVAVGVAVMKLQVRRLQLHAVVVGHLALEVQVNALVRLDADRQPIALQRRAGRQREHQVRRTAELNDDLAEPLRQRLAGAQEERHALPAPVVDVQLHGGERRRARVGGDALLAAIAGVLAA